MTRIVLHHVPESRSMRSLWLLNELGLPFEVKTYPFDKSLRHPDYLKLSPAGRVPSLELDGEVIFETGAIAQVLCERFSPDDLGRRADHAERASWLAWMHFAETISQHAAALTQQHIALREDWMRAPMVMKLEAARIGKCFDAVEGQLAGQDYLLPLGFSAADVSVGQAVYLGQLFHKLDAHPATSAWMARLTARAAFKASLPAEEARLYHQSFYEPWPVEPPDAG